jgi:hypothetical protein
MITMLAGLQAVSGSFFFNLTGALGFREGPDGKPMVWTDLRALEL